MRRSPRVAPGSRAARRARARRRSRRARPSPCATPWRSPGVRDVALPSASRRAVSCSGPTNGIDLIMRSSGPISKSSGKRGASMRLTASGGPGCFAARDQEQHRAGGLRRLPAPAPGAACRGSARRPCRRTAARAAACRHAGRRRHLGRRVLRDRRSFRASGEDPREIGLPRLLGRIEGLEVAVAAREHHEREAQARGVGVVRASSATVAPRPASDSVRVGSGDHVEQVGHAGVEGALVEARA